MSSQSHCQAGNSQGGVEGWDASIEFSFSCFQVTILPCSVGDWWMKHTWGTVVEWSWQRKSKYLEKKNLFPVPLYPPHIPHGLPCDWNRSFSARGRQLTTWVMTLLDELSLAFKQIKQSHIDTSWVSRQPWGSFEFQPPPDMLLEYRCRPFPYAVHNFIPDANSI